MDDLKDLEALRALVPPPPEQYLSSERLAFRKEVLMREIADSLGRWDVPEVVPSGPSARFRNYRRRIAALVLLPAALIGGAVAYSVTANRSAEQLGNYVTCFQAPNLGAPAAGTSLSGQDLAAFCDQQWTSGSIEAPP